MKRISLVGREPVRAVLSLRARLPQWDWEGVIPGTVREAASDAFASVRFRWWRAIRALVAASAAQTGPCRAPRTPRRARGRRRARTTTDTVIPLLVIRRAAAFRRQGEAPPSIGRGVVGKPEREGEDRSEAGERGSRSGRTRASAPTPGGRIRIQHSPGVVVRPGILRVRVLGEHDGLARIVGPVSQSMQAERALDCGPGGRGLHPGERIAVPHTPPSFHLDVP